MLSKSKYTRGSNCHKSLWLYVYKKQAQVIPEITQAIFKRGTNAGELAQQYFPGGKMAVLEAMPGYSSAKRTLNLIQQGVETIYEATFIYNDTLVAVDILHKQDGEWHLYEVKSTNSVKPEHIKDVAVQYYVAKGSGVDIGDVYLMHFDRDYVRHGEIEVNKLFFPECITGEVMVLQNEVETTIAELKLMLESNEPQIAMGKQCEKPYHCDFYDYCTNLLPPLPTTATKLSNEPIVDMDELKDFMAQLQYPLYYLDFETIMPGVPLFDESRPYQQLPFQYSLHHQDVKGGEIMHNYFLAESDLSQDPRPALIEHLIANTKEAKTILVYHIPFERGRLDEMRRDFPQYNTEIELIINRMVDLIIPFKMNHYRTETMEGSSSIKKVLPAICPELSYAELEIADGLTASNTFLEMYYWEDVALKQQTRENLLKYCHLDTLAMVKIVEVLSRSLK